MSRLDHRDDVIEDFAYENAVLREELDAMTVRAFSAEADRDAYRLLAVQAIHQLHDLQEQVGSIEERYHRALDDARSMRALVMGREVNRAA